MASSNELKNPFRCGPNPCEWPCSEVEVVCPECIPGTVPRLVLLEIEGVTNAFSCTDCPDAYDGKSWIMEAVQGEECRWFADMTDGVNYCPVGGPTPGGWYLGNAQLQFISNQYVLNIYDSLAGGLGTFRAAFSPPVDCNWDREPLQGYNASFPPCQFSTATAYLTAI